VNHLGVLDFIRLQEIRLGAGMAVVLNGLKSAIAPDADYCGIRLCLFFLFLSLHGTITYLVLPTVLITSALLS
jgi:hypothetical protein